MTLNTHLSYHPFLFSTFAPALFTVKFFSVTVVSLLNYLRLSYPKVQDIQSNEFDRVKLKARHLSGFVWFYFKLTLAVCLGLLISGETNEI